MACTHASCQCEIAGCGVDHPRGWKPKMSVQINTMVIEGDDLADCFAHYLLKLGYPRDRPAEVRRMGERSAERREGGGSAKRTPTQRR